MCGAPSGRTSDPPLTSNSLQRLPAPRIWHCHQTPPGPAAGQCHHRYVPSSARLASPAPHPSLKERPSITTELACRVTVGGAPPF